jgi:hypothetical protein
MSSFQGANSYLEYSWNLTARYRHRWWPSSTTDLPIVSHYLDKLAHGNSTLQVLDGNIRMDAMNWWAGWKRRERNNETRKHSTTWHCVIYCCHHLYILYWCILTIWFCTVSKFIHSFPLTYSMYNLVLWIQCCRFLWSSLESKIELTSLST